LTGPLLEPIANEVGKVIVQKLARLSVNDAKQAIRSVSRLSAGGVMVPGLGAFALGVVAGAGLALLLAPRTGTETRAAIGARIARLRGRVAPEL
jgi:hypothetical protein